MAITIGKHIDEESAEKYSLGYLSARKIAEVEKHLLLCETCRKFVTACDQYVAAMRKAAAKLRKAGQKPKRTAAG
jgi:hypothetical protein